VVWNYINKNYLLIEQYQEVKFFYYKFIRGIFISYYNSNIIRKDNTFQMFGEYNGIKIFDYYLLWITVNYSEYKELDKLIKMLGGLEIKINDENKELFINSFFNLLNFYTGNKPDELNNILKNYFLILNKIDLKENDIVLIYDKVIQNDRILVLLQNEYFTSFTINKIKKISNNENLNRIGNKIISSIIYGILEGKISYLILIHIRDYGLLSYIGRLFDKRIIKIEINKSTFLKIDEHLKEMKSNNNIQKDLIVDIICYIILPILKNNDKRIFKNLISKMISLGNIIPDTKKIELIYYSIYYGLFLNIKTKRILYKVLENIIIEYKNKTVIPDQIALKTDYLIRLIMNKKINKSDIPIKYLRLFKSNSKEFSFIIDPKSFPLQDFDPEWIMGLDAKYLTPFYKVNNDLNVWKKILENSTIDEKIKYRILNKLIIDLKLK
jgi:hypothetical protein